MLFFRSNDASFARGVLSIQSKNKYQKRSLISLQMCFMRCLYEVLASFAALFTPLLHKVGIPNVYLPDAILMSAVIPFANLMNDEETKEIIYKENWYQGLRYMLGIYVEPTEQHTEPESSVISKKRSNPLSSAQLLSTSIMNNSTCHKKSVLRRCESTPIFHYSREPGAMGKQPPLRRNKSHLDRNSIDTDMFNTYKCKHPTVIFHFSRNTHIIH
jgi:hypothetical protein